MTKAVIVAAGDGAGVQLADENIPHELLRCELPHSRKIGDEQLLHADLCEDGGLLLCCAQPAVSRLGGNGARCKGIYGTAAAAGMQGGSNHRPVPAVQAIENAQRDAAWAGGRGGLFRRQVVDIHAVRSPYQNQNRQMGFSWSPTGLPRPRKRPAGEYTRAAVSTGARSRSRASVPPFRKRTACGSVTVRAG